MTDSKPQGKSRRSWKRRLLIAGGSVIILLIAAWLVLTSGPVVKRLVLPRVAEALQAEIEVGSLKLKPFSRLELNQVTLKPEGDEQLMQAERLLVRYSLMSILGGTIAVKEAELVNPRVAIREKEDGTSNLSDWLEQLTPDEEKEEPVEIPKMDIGPVRIRNGEIRWVRQLPEGGREELDVVGIQLTLDQFAPGAASQLELESELDFRAFTTGPGNLPDSTLSTTLTGSLGLTPADNLVPRSLDGSIQLGALQASGIFADVAGVETTLALTRNTNEPAVARLVFAKGEDTMSEWTVTGDYQATTGDADFQLEASGLPEVVLKVLSRKLQWDFELQRFSLNSTVSVREQGDRVAFSGGLDAGQLRVSSVHGATPPLDLELQVGGNWSKASNRLEVSRLSLQSQAAGRNEMEIQLSDALVLAPGQSLEDLPDAAIDLQIRDLRPQDWKGLGFSNDITGVFEMESKLTVRSGGSEMQIAGEAEARNFSGTFNERSVRNLAGSSRFHGRLQDWNQLVLEQLEFDTSLGGNSLGSLSITGNARLADRAAELKAEVAVQLGALGPLLPSPTASARAGSLRWKGSASGNPGDLRIHGQLELDQFTGGYAVYQWEQLSLSATNSISVSSDQIQWNVENGEIQLKSQPAGTFGHNGTYSLSSQDLHSTAQGNALSGKLLAPLVDAGTGTAVVQSGEMGFNWNLQAEAGRDLRVSGQMNLNNFLVLRNGKPMSPKPLTTDAGVQLSFDATQQRLEIAQCRVAMNAGLDREAALNVTGFAHTDGRQVQLNGSLTNFTESVLGPWAPMVLGNKELISVLCNGGFQVDYQPDQPSAIQAHLDVENLRVRWDGQRTDDSPRHLRFRLDTNMKDRRFDIRELLVQLTPTERSKNRLNGTGYFDVSNPEALDGDITVTSEGMDLTYFHTLLSRTNAVPTQQPPPTDDSPQPIPDSLPFGDFQASLSINHLYLRDLVVSNWNARLHLTSNRIELDPFSMRVNGAPVNAAGNIHLTAAGADYDVTAETDGLALSPLVKTFNPGFNRLSDAEVHGTIRLKGVNGSQGIRWDRLQGEVHLGMTNANLRLLDPRWETALQPVASMLRAPELFESPVNWMYAHLRFTNGWLELPQASAVGDAFVGDLRGRFPLHAGAANMSLGRLPVDIYINSNLARSLKLFQPEDPNAPPAYFRLPTVAYLTGTAADPKVQIDQVALTGLLAGSAAGFVPGTAGDILKGVGNVAGGLGNILSGRKPSEAAEKPEDEGLYGKTVGGLFGGVKEILGGAGDAVGKTGDTISGRKQMKTADMKDFLQPFDWPRAFAGDSLPER